MRHRRPHGPDPASLRFIPDLTVLAGHGSAEAGGLYKELNALFPPALGAIFAIELASSDTYHDEALRSASGNAGSRWPAATWRLTYPNNLTGMPTISLPCRFDEVTLRLMSANTTGRTVGQVSAIQLKQSRYSSEAPATSLVLACLLLQRSQP